MNARHHSRTHVGFFAALLSIVIAISGVSLWGQSPQSHKTIDE